MRIDEALIVFNKLKNNTKNKAELAIYNNFIKALLDLEQRDFTPNQKKDLETKLFSLQLKSNSTFTKKDLNKKFTSFEDFLATKFSIISENYYVNKGMVLWLFSSILLFFCFGQFSVIGALFVTIITGIILDTEAKNQGRVIISNNKKEQLLLIDSLVDENLTNDNRKELQNYRRKKLQQFGQENNQLQEQILKKHQF